jgi:hypothetical protein
VIEAFEGVFDTIADHFGVARLASDDQENIHSRAMVGESGSRAKPCL